MKVKIEQLKMNDETKENINNLYKLLKPIIYLKLKKIFGTDIWNMKFKGIDLRTNKDNEYYAKILCEFISSENERICTNIYVKEELLVE